jgi:hypothetical protein
MGTPWCAGDAPYPGSDGSSPYRLQRDCVILTFFTKDCWFDLKLLPAFPGVQDVPQMSSTMPTQKTYYEYKL